MTVGGQERRANTLFGQVEPQCLGAMIHVIPEYTDADISAWRVPSGIGPGKDEAGGLLDTP